jgi:hypothetical protein
MSPHGNKQESMSINALMIMEENPPIGEKGIESAILILKKKRQDSLALIKNICSI